MTRESGFLEKYSVAPAPSRDYYGIRVFPNEVKFFLWKVSHGPHRTPIVRNANFDEFLKEKSLQDEIHRVFGESLLKYVRDLAAGKIKSWEENSNELDRGWARVLTEGESMKKPEDKNVARFDKKRLAKGKIDPAAAKGFGQLKKRSKFPTKKPLEVVKMNPLSKKTIVKVGENGVTDLTSGETSTTLDKVFEEESKTKHRESVLDGKITTPCTAKSNDKILDREETGNEKTTERDKMAADAKTAERNEMAAAARRRTMALASKSRKNISSSKSTILKTDKSLIEGFTSVENNHTNLARLIREDGKETNNYIGAVEATSGGDVRKKNESSRDSYVIENPWSSNSSLASISSPKDALIRRNLSKSRNESSTTDKYKLAREFLAKHRKMEVERGTTISQSKKKSNKVEILGKNSIFPSNVSPRFSSTGISDKKILDTNDRLKTVGAKKQNSLSTNAKSLQNLQTSKKIRSKSKTELSFLKKR